MQPPTRNDDLDQLRQRKIAVPALFRRGAWMSLALGTPDGVAPGPGATQLLLWLPVGSSEQPGAPSWAEVDALLGARGAASSRSVPLPAGALWDGGPGPEVIAAPDHWTVHGAEYPSSAFGSIFWKHGWALGTSAGLLVSLVSA